MDIVITIRSASIALVLIALSVVNPACAQDAIHQYVRQHSVQIRSIAPDSTEFSDLVPLGNAIGDARIVMLGEQDHGDASTFLAKTRLIKYLHEKKGFNVLAFESDFYLTDEWDKAAESPGRHRFPNRTYHYGYLVAL